MWCFCYQISSLRGADAIHYEVSAGILWDFATDMTSASAGRVPCHNVSDEYRDCADQTGCGTSHSAWGRSWDVEACRQIVYSTSTDNISDMFPAREWGPAQLSQYCEQTWNITPQTAWYRPWLSLILG